MLTRPKFYFANFPIFLSLADFDDAMGQNARTEVLKVVQNKVFKESTPKKQDLFKTFFKFCVLRIAQMIEQKIITRHPGLNPRGR